MTRNAAGGPSTLVHIAIILAVAMVIGCFAASIGLARAGNDAQAAEAL